MIPSRIRAFLASQRRDSPCLVLDLEVVREKYLSFARALPNTEIYYAVKANPHPAILELLVELGSSFDAAAIPEIKAVIAAGGTPENISYGNTIKKECDIAHASELGVRRFAVDSGEEVDKIVRAAPGAEVFCRILCDGHGADWPLSRKCGCDVNVAIEVLEHAHCSGLVAIGVSFHVGSQQLNPEAWDAPLQATSRIFRELGERGIDLNLVNLGGGFPAQYLKNVPTAATYGKAITGALRRHFGNRMPQTIIEPGRGLVGDAGVIKAEVVLVSRKSAQDAQRWVYLDLGKFGGLAETMDESIRYPIRTERDADETVPCVLAGPTCDSADVLYEKIPYNLPASLATGDEVLIEATGAYTTTYASVGFNGFPPLKSYILYPSSGKPRVLRCSLRGRRGLDRSAILDAAFDMLSRTGETGFSVRKLGDSIGVDPMTVLHHFGSKEKLLRRIADRALATVEVPPPSADWRVDLRNVAAAHRNLAHRHPRLFHLHFRFHASGPAAHASSEAIYRALRSAGLQDDEAAALGLGFYAFINGYALAQAEGLLRPMTDDDKAELRALDPLACPTTLALIPAFKALDRDAAFDASVDAFIEGVSCRCKAPMLRQRSRTQGSRPRAPA